MIFLLVRIIDLKQSKRDTRQCIYLLARSLSDPRERTKWGRTKLKTATGRP